MPPPPSLSIISTYKGFQGAHDFNLSIFNDSVSLFWTLTLADQNPVPALSGICVLLVFYLTNGLKLSNFHHGSLTNRVWCVNSEI